MTSLSAAKKQSRPRGKALRAWRCCQNEAGNGRLTIEVNNALLDSTYCAAHPDVVPGHYVMVAVSDTGTIT